MPYYKVENKESGKVDVVDADNRAQAFRLVGESILSVDLASHADVERHLSAGKSVLRGKQAQIEMDV